MLREAGEALLAGTTLGLWYDPFFAVLASAGAAALLGADEHARWRWRWPSAVVGVSLLWFAGDGARILLRAQGAGATGPIIDGAGWRAPLALATWALVGLAAGYVFPALVGVRVSRLVRGPLGWPTAVVVAIAVSLVLSAALSVAAAS